MSAIDALSKKCRECGEDKSTTEFYEQIQRSSATDRSWKHFDSLCKKCRGNATARRRIENRARAVAELGGACLDCGLVDPVIEIYDFHHLDPSEKDFGLADFWHRSWKRIVAEIKKCVLLCANCHRKRHALGL